LTPVCASSQAIFTPAHEKADVLVVDQSVLVACLKVAGVTVQSNQ
jgi:hypothetical protein